MDNKDSGDKNIGCTPMGFNQVLPIPSCVNGKWWSRQWFWYGIAFNALVCWWKGHELKFVPYLHSEKPFKAWECKRCSQRFFIEYTTNKGE